MNILFTYNKYPMENKGGVERVTFILMSEFIKRGHKCLFLLCHTNRLNITKFYFQNEHITDLKHFILENKIDTIINQNYNSSFVRHFIKTNIKNINLITCYHDSPGSLLIGLKMQLKKGGGKTLNSIANKISLCFYPMYYQHIKKKYIIDLRTNYTHSNKFVLLSEKFKQRFLKELDINEADKLYYIPNPLTYDSYFPVDKIQNKKNIFLVVARLEESQKRISEILQIWSKFQDTYLKSNLWEILIIGDGPDKITYQNYVKINNIKNIIFKGRLPPLEYYKQASIFLMTSSHEGWGLTLTESMQNGVIPIAYKSYESITDIITDKKDGFLIANNDQDAFLHRMIELCDNSCLRATMAIKAIESSKQFSKDIIINKWLKLIQHE